MGLSYLAVTVGGSFAPNRKSPFAPPQPQLEERIPAKPHGLAPDTVAIRDWDNDGTFPLEMAEMATLVRSIVDAMNVKCVQEHGPKFSRPRKTFRAEVERATLLAAEAARGSRFAPLAVEDEASKEADAPPPIKDHDRHDLLKPRIHDLVLQNRALIKPTITKVQSESSTTNSKEPKQRLAASQSASKPPVSNTSVARQQENKPVPTQAPTPNKPSTDKPSANTPKPPTFQDEPTKLSSPMQPALQATPSPARKTGAHRQAEHKRKRKFFICHEPEQGEMVWMPCDADETPFNQRATDGEHGAKRQAKRQRKKKVDTDTGEETSSNKGAGGFLVFLVVMSHILTVGAKTGYKKRALDWVDCFLKSLGVLVLVQGLKGRFYCWFTTVRILDLEVLLLVYLESFSRL